MPTTINFRIGKISGELSGLIEQFHQIEHDSAALFRFPELIRRSPPMGSEPVLIIARELNLSLQTSNVMKKCFKETKGLVERGISWLPGLNFSAILNDWKSDRDKCIAENYLSVAKHILLLRAKIGRAAVDAFETQTILTMLKIPESLFDFVFVVLYILTESLALYDEVFLQGKSF